MANTGVTGRVVDELGDGIGGLRVVVLDKDGLWGDAALGSTTTSATGDFAVSYPPGAYGLESSPDIVVRMHDVVGRVLAETPVREDVTDLVLALPPVVVRRAVASGFAAMLGAETAPMVSDGNDIEFLVDNEDAWATLTRSIRAATTSVHLGQLYVDALPFGDPGKHGRRLFTEFPGATPAGGVQPEQELLDAAARGVAVRVLLNDFRWFFAIPVLGALTFPNYPFDAAARFGDYVSDAVPPTTAQCRLAPMPQFTPMHAKITVIDGREAFLVGSPLVQEYFDDSRHRLDNGKRGWFNWADTLMVPTHDVSARVTGPAVADLDRTFCLLWNQERPTGSAPVAPAQAPPPRPADLRMQVTRSLRGEERYDDVPGGEAGIYESYLRAIAAAETYVYLENQYVTSVELVEALLAAVRSKPALQVILAVNAKVDIPLYGGWQRRLLDRFHTDLDPAQRARVGIFTVWSHEAGGSRATVARTYLHTKVGIVDDCWVTVGSANLDSVGQTSSQHVRLLSLLLLGLPSMINAVTGDELDFGNQRSAEANVAVFGSAGGPVEPAARLRCRLWAEHLGLVTAGGDLRTDDPSLATAPPGGWLQLWQDAAEAKRAALVGDPSVPVPSRVLAMPRVDGRVPGDVGDPVAYLAHLGVDPARLDVREKVRQFSFANGTWLDA